MAEIVQTSRVMTFDMECPTCHRGRMRYHGILYQSCEGEPPKYMHVCSCCGSQSPYDKIYPDHVLLSEGEIFKIEEM